MPTSHAKKPLSFGRRPPPDYTQRNVKLRLFIYVAAIMAVLWAIERARKPDTWQWLWRDTQPVANRFDSRLQDAGHRTAQDPAGTFVAVADSKSDHEVVSNGFPDPVERAWQQGWNDILSRLPADQQDLLFELLYIGSSERDKALEDAEKEPAAEVLKAIQRLWDDYHSVAFQAVAELKPDEQATWVDVLRQVNGRFANEVLPALTAIGKGTDLDDLQRTALEQLDEALASLGRAAIQDDTPALRPAERNIWFHELARIQEQERVGHRSTDRVTYLQLQKQAADYRGKQISLKGTIRLAYRSPAPANYLGLKEFCVYDFQPVGAPDSHIFVYAIAAPLGFPRFDAPREMREDAEFTGIFFKRFAYAAKGGTYTAPLMLADTPHWQPSPLAQGPGNSLNALELAGAAIAALLLSICVAAVLWKRTGASRRHTAQRPPGGFIDLGPLQIGPSTKEKIRELERQARGGGNG